MEYNLIKILFILNSVSVTLLGFVLKIAEPYIPIAITKLFRYGKFAVHGKSSVIPTLEVPKRWFKHFYEFAAPAATCTLFLVFKYYLGFGAMPNFVYPILDFFLGENRKPLVSTEHAALALILLTAQCWKRFYEVHYVSVFSDAKINLGHYVLGFLHYIGAILSMIGESEGFFEGSEHTGNWDTNRLANIDYFSAVVFLWASYKQLRCNFILAELRKNKKGEVLTLQYRVPNGGLFDYISSPLQTTEILMYAMLTIILWNSVTFHYIFFWVLTNQMATGLFGHWWYVEKFEDYPKQRKALIPLIL